MSHGRGANKVHWRSEDDYGQSYQVAFAFSLECGLSTDKNMLGMWVVDSGAKNYICTDKFARLIKRDEGDYRRPIAARLQLRTWEPSWNEWFS